MAEKKLGNPGIISPLNGVTWGLYLQLGFVPAMLDLEKDDDGSWWRLWSKNMIWMAISPIERVFLELFR